MPSAKVIITGLKSIDRKLRILPIKVQKKVVRQAIRAGLKVMANEVRAQVPVDTGLTKKNVKVRAVGRRKRGSIALEVVVKAVADLKKTSKYGGKAVFYPAVVEYGRKGVAPNPFARRAFTAKGEAARNVTIEKLREGTNREIESL